MLLPAAATDATRQRELNKEVKGLLYVGTGHANRIHKSIIFTTNAHLNQIGKSSIHLHTVVLVIIRERMVRSVLNGLSVLLLSLPLVISSSALAKFRG